jgi:integrase/recombinase XerD
MLKCRQKPFFDVFSPLDSEEPTVNSSYYTAASASVELGGDSDEPAAQTTYLDTDADAGESEFQNAGSESTPLALTLEKFVAGQLSMHTRRAYAQDARLFVEWLARHNLTLATLSGSDFQLYRRHLSDTFAKTTAARKLVVARKLLDAAVERGLLAVNPAKLVKGFSGSTPEANQTGYVALALEQARELLRTVDTTTKQGKRDWVILALLIRTGLRRSECAALQLGDLAQELGHHILVLRHAKGDKRRKVKLPVDVRRALDDYLIACGRKIEDLPPTAPLFVRFYKGDKPTELPLGDARIARLVEYYAGKLGLDISPHSLRATFVTLALEGGARLDQVQYAVGHADPRTTERYQQSKLNLDHHAVDFIKF